MDYELDMPIYDFECDINIGDKVKIFVADYNKYRGSIGNSIGIEKDKWELIDKYDIYGTVSYLKGFGTTRKKSLLYSISFDEDSHLLLNKPSYNFYRENLGVITNGL